MATAQLLPDDVTFVDEKSLRKHVTAVISNLEHVLHDLEGVVTDMRDLVGHIDKVTNTIDIQYGVGFADECAGQSNENLGSQDCRPRTKRLRSKKSSSDKSPRNASTTNVATSTKSVERDYPAQKQKKRRKSPEVPRRPENDYNAQSDYSYVSDDDRLSLSARDHLMNTSLFTNLTTPEYFSVDDVFEKGDMNGSFHASGHAHDKWSEFPAIGRGEHAGDNASDMGSVDDFNSTTFAWDSHGIEFLEELHSKFDISSDPLAGNNDVPLDTSFFDEDSIDDAPVFDRESSTPVSRQFEPKFRLDLESTTKNRNKKWLHSESIVSPCVVCKCEHAQKEVRKYCSVYEHEMESRLESVGDGFDGDSFSECSECVSNEYELDSVDNCRDYTPTYDRGINTWTSYALVQIDNDDTQYETNSDILNDNVTTSTCDRDHFYYDVSDSNVNVPSFTDEIIKTYDLTSADTVDVISDTTSKRRSLPDIINMTDRQGRYVATN